MADSRKPAKSQVPSGARPPSDRAVPLLRGDDVAENEGLRGLVVRAGVGALPAVWED